jgi:TonB-dependent receptor
MAGLHARWLALNDRLVVRAAFTEGLSRPAPADLIGSVQENAQLNQRNIGNPALKAATSRNYDASVEYYLPRVGVVSASVFQKDIEKFVFTSSRAAADGVRENLKVNGDGGKLTGLEFVWQQNLTSLPAPFDGFGFELNHTWLNSEGKYPGRTIEDLAFVLAPRTIFNGMLSYAKGPFGARVSYNKMAKRLESVSTSALTDTYNAAAFSWDLALKYRLPWRLNLFFNVKNLTNEPSVIYQGTRANPTAIVYYGVQYNFGLTLDL